MFIFFKKKNIGGLKLRFRGKRINDKNLEDDEMNFD
jgi:hypothetical protein